MKKIRIGSRESRLALVQTNMVADYLHGQGVETELVTMKTTGDIILNRSLEQIGGKGLFVKELDLALMEDRSDLSVHSLKDVPVVLDERLPLIGYSEREDPRDVLVLPKGVSVLNREKPIGCSSRRRVLQAEKLFPGMEFKSIRGNVNTRLKKLDDGEYGALILAAAGLVRLGLSERISRYFEVTEMIPSAGQGILALQGVEGKDYSVLDGYCNRDSFWEATCERAFIRQLGGSCTMPVAAHAVVEGERILLRGMYAEEGKRYVTGTLEGDVANAERVGEELAERLKREYRGSGE
jgi:hydroxymethylbilane synthase